MSRSRLIFILFYLTSILIITVLLRTNSSRIFFKYRDCKVDQDNLQRQLWKQQLNMAALTSPGEVSKRAKKFRDKSGNNE